MRVFFHEVFVLNAQYILMSLGFTIYIDEFSFCGPCVDAEQITDDVKIGLFCVVVGYFVQDI